MHSVGYRAPVKRKTLFGVVGALAATLLFTGIPLEESGRTVTAKVAPSGQAMVRHVRGPQYLRAYLDIVRVPTACDGITKGVRLGQTYTEAQCTILLEDELVVHAEGLLACVPQLRAPSRDYQRAAAVGWAYNVGVRGACGSTAARRWRAGQWRAGCDAMLAWNKAGGRVVAGLVARRKRERDLCVRGLAA